MTFQDVYLDIYSIYSDKSSDTYILTFYLAFYLTYIVTFYPGFFLTCTLAVYLT